MKIKRSYSLGDLIVDVLPWVLIGLYFYYGYVRKW